MKHYQLKMQWLLRINSDFCTTQKQARKQINNFIDAIGAKNLTAVYFRDRDLKIVDQYTNMVMYPTIEESNKALKRLVAGIKPKSDIQYIEFVRK